MLQSEWFELQVYEHVVPLQLSVDAFVGVQAMPHPVQFVVVLVGVSHPSVSGATLALQSPQPWSHS